MDKDVIDPSETDSQRWQDPRAGRRHVLRTVVRVRLVSRKVLLPALW